MSNPSDLEERLARQKTLQATLVAQNAELEKKQADLLEKGKRDAAELQKQMDSQYEAHKKRMTAVAGPSAAPTATRSTGFVVDFSAIPVFAGDGDDGVSVEDFLCAVEGVVSFHDLSQKDLFGLLQAKTRQAARRFVGRLSAEERASMGAVKKAFLKEYKIPTPRGALEVQFADCKQKRFESVAEFYHRLLKVSHRLEVATPAPDGADPKVWADMWEDRRVNKFMTGLKPELRRALIGREPKTLQEARTVAVSAEEVETTASLQEQEQVGVSAMVSALRHEDTYHSRISQLRQEELALMEARVAAMRVNLSSAPQEMVTERQPMRSRVTFRERSRSKSPRRVYQFHSDGAKVQDTSCFLCREEGHWISDCPLRMCGRCGQKGHLPRSCPGSLSDQKN
jgi:hypothetical protein